MAAANGEIDVLRVGRGVVFQFLLLDESGMPVTGGLSELYLYEVQADGTLHSFDFADGMFKSQGLTIEAAQAVHRRGNGDTRDTGIWTYALDEVGAFSDRGAYIVLVHHAGASPPWQGRRFQYGGSVDEIHLTKAALVNKRLHTVDTGVNEIRDDDGETTLRTLTPSESNGVISVTPG